ncbi:glycosyltransferase EpsF2 [Paenibacillus sabinae T27]|uniref:Glycosyltransferase EpsF2 n=1 Tax=Paenibacillus sabinae T27 TaxID=1268072 RepID=X4ZMX8_9BACL|nr:glycosyltransferase EpsF2 [Paenibacillus sabinae T27]
MFGNKACKTGDFYIINNSIEAEKFIFNESVRMLIRKELQIEDKFVIGHVGRFDEQKNHYGLIEIFKEVHDQKFNSVLLLVGNGKLKSQIEEKVNKLGLKDSVIFTGARSDVSELMQAMDIFVFPSLREGLGIVVIEAAASGLHCIVSDSIPKEAYVTSQIESVPLKDNAFIWAGKILNYSDGYERVNALENIKEHNYNVQDTANWIENFYLEVVDK